MFADHAAWQLSRAARMGNKTPKLDSQLNKSSLGPAQALHLRLSQSGAIEPAAGACEVLKLPLPRFERFQAFRRVLNWLSICAAFAGNGVNGWVGKIKTLSTNNDGRGVLAVEIAKDVVAQDLEQRRLRH
jgi:hypothetical protein